MSNYKFKQGLSFSAQTPKFLQGLVKQPTRAQRDSDEDDQDGPKIERELPKRPNFDEEDDDNRQAAEDEKPQIQIDPSNFTAEELEEFLEKNPDAQVGDSKKKGGKKGDVNNPLKRKMEQDAAAAEKKLSEASNKDAPAGKEQKIESTIGPTAKKPKPKATSTAAGVKNKKLLSFDED